MEERNTTYSKRDIGLLERKTAEAEALATIIADMFRLHKLDEILQSIIERAAELMNAERGVIFLYDSISNTLVPNAQIGHKWETYQHIRLKPQEGTSGHVFATGKPYISDYASIQDLKLDSENEQVYIQSVTGQTDRLGMGIAVPIQQSERIIGTLSIGSGQRPFSRDDLHFLERLSEQIAMAIERNQQRIKLIRAEQANAIGHLSAGVCHNLNNLLTGILIPAHILCEIDSPEVREHAETICEAGQRANNLVKQLQKSVQQKSSRSLHTIALSPSIHGALETTRQRWINSDTEYSIRTDCDNQHTVWGDESDLQTLLVHLIDNAIDAMPNGGTLYLGSEMQKNRTTLTIGDTGIGMDASTRQHLFDPFFTTKAAVGAGLSLAIVYNIVKLWGGSIQVESQVGRQTIFTLDLRST
jgi:signal transduction histidine kinase